MIKLSSCLFVTLVFFSQFSFAQSYAVDSDQAVDAEELFVACAFCHGPQGQGGPAVDAPPLAGREAWYIERQLLSYANRVRGIHPDDVPGLQMSIVSGMSRNMATIKNLSAYIANMEPNGEPELYYGEPITNKNRNWVWDSEFAVLNHPEPADASRGEEFFTGICLVCHGPAAQGNETLGAPNLTMLPEWYIHRQLQYFKNGIRGADTRDTYGMQMAAFVNMLPDQQAIADVTAYILTLGGQDDE